MEEYAGRKISYREFFASAFQSIGFPTQQWQNDTSNLYPKAAGWT